MKLAIWIVMCFFVMHTALPQEIEDYPYLEDFEESNWNTDGWLINASVDAPFERRTNFSRPDAYQSDYCLSALNGDGNHTISHLLSPVFRFDSIEDATFSLKYYCTGGYSSYPSYFQVMVSVNQGPWIALVDQEIVTEPYWQGYQVQLAQYIPDPPEATIVQFQIQVKGTSYRSRAQDVRVDKFEIKNVKYRGSDFTAHYGWEKIDTAGLLLPNGKIAINAQHVDPDYTLWVNGGVKASEVLISVDSVPDYVFAPNYQLRSLEKLEEYLRIYRHLPGVPSEHQYKQTGVDLGRLNMLLLEKVEELTLYVIDLQAQIDTLYSADKIGQK